MSELARVKAELEREKQEKAQLANQLSQQNLKEGGEPEISPSKRFIANMPSKACEK